MMRKPKKHTRVILMGRKSGAAKALLWLVKNRAVIPFVVASATENGPRTLAYVARRHKIPVITDPSRVYVYIKKKDARVRDVDLVISYLFTERIKQALIDLPKYGCVNYHPAPLPEYKSRAGYNTAILDQKASYGVSVHFIDSEQFDVGPIIRVVRFPIDPENELAYTLERRAQEHLYRLFERTMPSLLSGFKIRTTPNVGGLYLTAKQLETMKIVDMQNDSTQIIDRKIRAFFFPPYSGATVHIKGKPYTLINDDILEFLKGNIKQ
jgi:methionyl-tRNA formyltransferase